jgi:calmodulin
MNKLKSANNFAQYDEDVVAGIKEAFSLFDKDNNNSIKGSDFASVLKALGHDPTKSEVLDMLNDVGKNLDNQLEYLEFLALYERKKSELEVNASQRVAFRMFDRTEKGYITPEDVVFTLEKLGSPVSIEKATELIRSSSLYGYSKLNFEEFVVCQLF